jgi:outer membrane protein assembly factor BamB
MSAVRVMGRVAGAALATALAVAPGAMGMTLSAGGAGASSGAAGGSSATMSFHSQGFHPPRVFVTADPDAGSGDVFLAAKHLGSRLHFQRGPIILDSRGRLVWFQPVNGKITNLEVQHYNGHPVLTWWESRGKGGRAFDVILNRAYKTVAVLHAGHGYRADSHEFQITRENTALIDATFGTHTNLSSVGGPSNGLVSDCVILELNIKTGRLIWKWNALSHIPVSASYAPYRPGQRYDYLHMNSLQELPNGNILMSGRNTWAVYEIDRHTGRIIWTLGGKNSSFSMGSGTQFSWQHDAHLYPGGRLSLFDDASNGFSTQASQSSGEVMHLNLGSRTATLAHRYYHSPPLIASSQGSTQILPNGNVFVGWGDQPDFSEYRPDGQQIFNGAFPFGAQSYRAYRFHWSGLPAAKPSLALSPQPGGSVRLWASWNGATDVKQWRVLGGPARHRMARLGGRGRTGFETAMKPASEPAYFEVQALGSGGRVLGTSTAHADPPHVAIFGQSAFVRAGSGTGAVAVGCLTRQTCHLSVRIASGGTVLAQTSGPVSRGRGRPLHFKLSHAGRSKLRQARGRLAVTVTVRDSISKRTASRRMALIPYSISGPSQARTFSQSPTLQLIEDSGFVASHTGSGQVMAGCYGASPCRVRVTVEAGGRRIARSKLQYLGLNELGAVHFSLSPAGRRMLQHARGNQLPARITLTDANASAVGHTTLVGYG